MSQDNSIIPVEPRKTEIDGLLHLAIDKGVPVETLERLLAMQRERYAEIAKNQFDADLAALQNDCPFVKKTTPVKDRNNRLLYKYAKLEDIFRQVKPFLKKFNFSHCFETNTGENKISITCIAKHIAGHSESSTIDIPIAKDSKLMSDAQTTAAALTFGKRYSFLNVFGLVVEGDDNEQVIINDPRPAVVSVEDKIQSTQNLIKKTNNHQALSSIHDRIISSKELTNEQRKSLEDMIEVRHSELA